LIPLLKQEGSLGAQRAGWLHSLWTVPLYLERICLLGLEAARGLVALRMDVTVPGYPAEPAIGQGCRKDL